ncbi:cytochrome P450 [Eremomyces bilateralis CBS 781.70]|uniref:Cytochrome P450 n=1 Tax=Eremomyces bilateralis CBS 781.70 TaxID=1392243 RepID=A0A6G1FW91_9PEZI|nr:cytochrome P450 [Eremomyces bilateralis CBS 781.70]KAF1809998.1 cytochrome P450 [Eremomyces bilateralis CBS 781.70]
MAITLSNDQLPAFAQSPIRVGAILLVLGVVLYQILKRSFKRYPCPLPPSPPAEPLLGHFRTLPPENAHLKHMEYAKRFNSDIVYFNVLGNHTIVLNSQKVANEILDKRGANYQDRPGFVLFDVMGWGLTLTFMPYGPRFKLHRSALQHGFTKTAIVNYRPIQEDEARQAIARILKRPTEWDFSLRRFASAIVLRIGFGVTVRSDDDPYIKIAIDANMATAKGGNPGAALVDYMPPFRFIPEFLNFSGTLQHARKWRWAIKNLHDIPFAAIKKEFDEGTANPSFAYSLLSKYTQNEEKGIPNQLEMKDIQGASGSVFIAGSNTTLATTTVALLNIMRNPEVFMKARAELDRVVGEDRLPSLADRPNLRYLDYVVEETTRWRPLSPIGIPHKSLKDDTYNGMFIPAGTFVYYNTYAMSRDENVYKNPEIFNPDRYTPKEEGGDGEPFLVGPFGFGRRICVGRHLAQASVWIAVATMIATTDISKPVSPDGRPIDQPIVFSTGLSSHPGKFDVNFQPRSEKATRLLAQAVGDAQ